MKAIARLLATVMLLVGPALLSFGEQSYGLPQLVRAAEANSPDIHRLENAAAADMAALAGARAATRPTVSMLNTYSFIGNPQPPYVVSAGSLGTVPIGGNLVSLPQQNVTVVQGQDDRNVGLAVTIDQPIFVWGKIRANIALHEKLVATDNLQVKKQRDETRTMVTVNLYSLYYLDQIRRILEEQKSVADELLAIARDSLKAGQITEATLIEKRMSIEEITHAIVGVDNQREKALTNLRYLTGLITLPSSSISFSGLDIALAGRALPNVGALVSRAARNNNDLQLLALAQQIREKQVAVAKADEPFRPELALNVQLGVNGSRLPGVQPNWESYDNWTATVTLAVKGNLYDGGKARSKVHGAKAQREEAFYQSEAATRRIGKYITETRYELDMIRQDIDYYRQRVKDTEQIAAYQKRLLDTGAGSRLDYFQKRVDVFTERIEVLKQELGYATNYFTLMNVVGGTAAN